MAEGPARVQRGAGVGVDAILSGPGEGSATQVMLWQVVFHMWRDAARERPQSSVLTVVRPLRDAVVSTLRTLPIVPWVSEKYPWHETHCNCRQGWPPGCPLARMLPRPSQQ